jgi:hypothetical protein
MLDCASRDLFAAQFDTPLRLTRREIANGNDAFEVVWHRVEPPTIGGSLTGGRVIEEVRVSSGLAALGSHHIELCEPPSATRKPRTPRRRRV